MASLKDARGLAEELHDLSGRLKSEVDRGSADFGKLVGIADRIGESADEAATTFDAINRSLTSLFEEGPSAEGQGDEAPAEGGKGDDGAAGARSRSSRSGDGGAARRSDKRRQEKRS